MTSPSLIDRARAFRRAHVDPYAAQWERQREVPVATLRTAAEKGFLALEVPVALGGRGIGFMDKLGFVEEMSRSCMAFTFSLINTQNVTARLAANGTERQRTELVPDLMAGRIFGATALSEPGAGSDFSAISTRAEKTQGGWLLTGEKGWITNASIADVFVTYAQTDPAARARGVASFLVDARAPGFERVAPYALMGGHAIGAGGFKLNKYFVKDDDVLGLPGGPAFKSAMAGVNGARVYVAAMCAGLVAASLEVAVDYCAKRQTFGQPVLDHQGMKWALASVATDLEAIRALTARAGQLIATDQDAIMAAAHAKKFATEKSLVAIGACIQAMGANGLREDYPLGRHLASAKIAAYTDGSIEMMNERIGAGLRDTYGSA